MSSSTYFRVNWAAGQRQRAYFLALLKNISTSELGCYFKYCYRIKCGYKVVINKIKLKIALIKKQSFEKKKKQSLRDFFLEISRVSLRDFAALQRGTLLLRFLVPAKLAHGPRVWESRSSRSGRKIYPCLFLSSKRKPKPFHRRRGTLSLANKEKQDMHIKTEFQTANVALTTACRDRLRSRSRAMTNKRACQWSLPNCYTMFSAQNRQLTLLCTECELSPCWFEWFEFFLSSILHAWFWLRWRWNFRVGIRDLKATYFILSH